MGQIVVMQAQTPTSDQSCVIEDVQYGNNKGYVFKPNNNLPNYYHPRLRNHENLSYRNPSNAQNTSPGFHNQGASSSNYQGQEKQPSLEEIINTFVNESRKRMDSHNSWMSNMEANV